MHLRDAEGARLVVEAARAAGSIALDTEFMRERTYWARLCLVQIAVGDEAWVIDPLQGGDVGWLADVLFDETVVKIFHAGGQDLEILYRIFGRATSPVFDTQIAATLAGFPSQVGYGRLVKQLFDVDVDKSDTFTDWARRPLTAGQLEYALNDVRHLAAAYELLRDRLRSAGRLDWLAEDFDKLVDPATFEVVPEEQYLRIKRASSLSRRQLGVLREVAAWRELEAQRRDLPKRWVVGDESLLEVARRRPDSAADLGAVRGLNVRSLGDAGHGLLEAVRRAIELPEDLLPRVEKRTRTLVDIEGVVELMGALVRMRASEHDVAVPLLATRADLERLASGERDGSPLLSGWRRTIVGEELLELVEGRLSLRVLDGKILAERVPPGP